MFSRCFSACVFEKQIEANHAPYISTALTKTIMSRSNTETLHRRKRTEQSFQTFRRQKKLFYRTKKNSSRIKISEGYEVVSEQRNTFFVLNTTLSLDITNESFSETII